MRKLWSPKISLCQAPLPGQLAVAVLLGFILMTFCSLPHTTRDCYRYVALPGYRVTFSISSSWAQALSTFPSLPWVRLWSCDGALMNGMWEEVKWATSRYDHQMPLRTYPILSLSLCLSASRMQRLQDGGSLYSFQESLLKTSSQTVS